MQPLTAAPRAHLSAGQVRAVLAADDLYVTCGADLLDTDDQVAADLSADLRGGTITWNGAADLHRSCDLLLDRELAWGRDRVRPWQELTSPVLGITARFWLGVFVITAPTLTADASTLDGAAVTAWQAKGWDKTYLLRSPIGDTWATRWTETGQATTVSGEVRRLLAAAGYTGPGARVVLPDDLADRYLTEPLVWPLADGATTYLRVLDDVLAAAGASKLWMDHAGVGHATMLAETTTRPTEWTLDADDPATTHLGPIRSRTLDLAEVPNAWLFINQNVTAEPLLGQGLYDPGDNLSDGPASIASRGYRLRKVTRLDATDQRALIAQGDAAKAKDIRATGTRTAAVAPLPLVGHDDLYEIRDTALGPPVRALATAWTLDLNGADIPLTLQEVP